MPSRTSHNDVSIHLCAAAQCATPKRKGVQTLWDSKCIEMVLILTREPLELVVGDCQIDLQRKEAVGAVGTWRRETREKPKEPEGGGRAWLKERWDDQLGL